MRIPQLYDIQKQFIKDCRSVIENEDIGIFSSPTGSGKTLSLLLSIVDDLSEKDEDDFLETIFNISTCKNRIYFCSRTHAQLKQCINEFKKLEIETDSIILGSRKIYCINNEIDKSMSIENINSSCRDLVEQEKCGYFDNVKKQNCFNGILDIEDLITDAKKNSYCPYFFAKRYFKNCEIVFLPYNILFSDENRAYLNINLNSTVVIVDEAHNIVDSVINMNTKTISTTHIIRYIEALKKYKNKCKDRSKNQFDVSLLLDILIRLEEFVKPNDDITKIIDVNEFLIKTSLFNINMFEIEEDVKRNKLCYKLEGYVRTLDYKLFEILKFLNLLVNSDENCKVEYSSKHLRIFPINASIYFDPFLKCKSVIFAGGTMEPIDTLRNIFRKKNVRYFSYENQCVNHKSFIISSIDSISFELKEKTRDSEKTRKDILFAVENIFSILKQESGGIVIFVPSKYYLEIFKGLLGDTSMNCFFEYQHSFNEFAISARRRYSILFAVMGGNFSEGINFSDDLCRILVIFGVPYPNLTHELEERIKYYGTEYYTQIAMKKVNQTIGRAIRHKDDYASILLIDKRYITLSKYLSPWISRDIKTCNLNDALNESSEFLKSKKINSLKV